MTMDCPDTIDASLSTTTSARPARSSEGYRTGNYNSQVHTMTLRFRSQTNDDISLRRRRHHNQQTDSQSPGKDNRDAPRNRRTSGSDGRFEFRDNLSSYSYPKYSYKIHRYKTIGTKRSSHRPIPIVTMPKAGQIQSSQSADDLTHDWTIPSKS